MLAIRRQYRPADPGTFDLIHVRSMLTHLRRSNGFAALRKLVRILRPDEQILIEDLSLIDTADPNHPDAAPMVENIAGWYRFYSPSPTATSERAPPVERTPQ